MPATLTPTAEQARIIDTYRAGQQMVVQARAGTGKTSTLKMLASAAPDRSGIYIAYNRAIATDAARSFPRNIECRTAHSLAFRAVGHQYKKRLDSPRQPARIVAQILGVRPLRIDASLILSETQVARIMLDTVARFCQSADPEITRWHVPFIEGITDPEARGRLRDTVVPLARKAWADLSQTEGQLRFQHDHYLKLWQLQGPRLDVDAVMLDECQPPGTMVDTPQGQRPIEDLREGDLVVSYSQSGIYLSERGSRISGVTHKPFTGQLVTVQAGERTTRYTPNHHCIVRLGDVFDGRWLLYLMRRGHSFRVGVTQFKHGRRNQSAAGLRSRLTEEGGDAMWVLDAFDHCGDALLAEREIVARYGIPDVIFQRNSPATHFDQDRLDAFWQHMGDLRSSAELLLARFGRHLRYPLVQPDHHLLFTRPTIVRAANLMAGMRVLDVDRYREAGGRGAHPEKWAPVEKVGRENYLGPVISMTVEDHHTYVGDGIVTHNCQDANPLIADIVERQTHAQRVMVGDAAQAIYGWNGAIDAMSKFDPAAPRLYLSESFRFGPAIAGEANKWLGILGEDPKVTGRAAHASIVASDHGDPDAILCRTNAGAVGELMVAAEAGKRAALVGGGDAIKRLAEAARELQRGAPTSHPELIAFQTWGQVRDYVEQESAGSDLKVFVKLIDDHGADMVIATMDRLVDERYAQVVVSTAHKAKGREWDRVRVAGDFREPKVEEASVSPDEAMLAYVTVTRAKRVLDRGGLAWVDGWIAGPSAAVAGQLVLEDLDDADIEGNPLPDEDDQAPLGDFQPSAANEAPEAEAVRTVTPAGFQCRPGVPLIEGRRPRTWLEDAIAEAVANSAETAKGMADVA